MISPDTLTAALASADAHHTALTSRAASLAGKPTEHAAWAAAGTAHRIAANLRMLLATAPTEGTS